MRRGEPKFAKRLARKIGAPRIALPAPHEFKRRYELALKVIPELRPIHDRFWNDDELPPDAEWRDVIFPALLPTLHVGADGYADLTANVSDDVVERAAKFAAEFGGGRLRTVVTIFPVRIAEASKLPTLPGLPEWTRSSVTVAYVMEVAQLVMAMLRPLFDTRVDAALRYHDVDINMGPGPRLPYGKKPFDLAAWEAGDMEGLLVNTANRPSVPGDVEWLLGVVAHAVANFPPTAHALALAKRLAKVGDDDLAAATYTELLAEQVKLSLHDQLVFGNHSRHELLVGLQRATSLVPSASPPVVNVNRPHTENGHLIDELSYLKTWFRERGGVSVEPVLPIVALDASVRTARAAIAANNRDARVLARALDEVAALVIANLVRHSGTGLYALDDVLRAQRRHRLLMLLLIRAPGSAAQPNSPRDRWTPDEVVYWNFYEHVTRALDEMSRTPSVVREIDRWRFGETWPVERLLTHAQSLARDAGREEGTSVRRSDPEKRSAVSARKRRDGRFAEVDAGGIDRSTNTRTRQASDRRDPGDGDASSSNDTHASNADIVGPGVDPFADPMADTQADRDALIADLFDGASERDRRFRDDYLAGRCSLEDAPPGFAERMRRAARG